ncbi:AraC family transcriptional regulator [Burkholderia contaminans]|uniref:AraC family transcriptional regulator n=1 Tax=Burkholderia contaminans TaxID=488447 RepID=UPI002651F9BA|nr:AraC family transcriptional regulator [Burkholderia contaminans]MDN7789089.1 AraC family transcriptional regulator [Burkholderia contaminans]
MVAHGRRARDVGCDEIAPLDALRVAGHEVKPADRRPFFPGARQGRDSDRRVAGVPARRREATTQPMNCMVEPSFGLVVQGTMRPTQSGDVYLCDANRSLITSLDLPGSMQVIEASRERPFLGIGLKLDFRVTAELMALVAADHEEAPAGRGVVVGDMNEPLYDAVNRLLALLDDSNAIAVLAPYIELEIYYRLLTSD